MSKTELNLQYTVDCKKVTLTYIQLDILLKSIDKANLASIDLVRIITVMMDKIIEIDEEVKERSE